MTKTSFPVTGGALGFLRNKGFLGALLILGFAYVTYFCFVGGDPWLETNTASMIGVRHPAQFFLWLLLTGAVFFFNNRAMYENYHCPNRLGRALAWAALFAFPVVFLVNGQIINGEVVLEGIRKVIHWSATGAFIACNALAILLVFLYARRQARRFNILCAGVVAVVAGMLAILLTIGKSALFEAVPIWAAYIMLFLVNCTGLFPLPAPSAPQ